MDMPQMKRPKDIEKWTGEIAEFAREVEDVTGRALTPLSLIHI